VDGQFGALIHYENHYLEHVPRPVRPNDKPTIWILPGVLSGECMVNGMTDVFVDYAVLTGRRMDLHENLVYYENSPEWRDPDSNRGHHDFQGWGRPTDPPCEA